MNLFWGISLPTFTRNLFDEIYSDYFFILSQLLQKNLLSPWQPNSITIYILKSKETKHRQKPSADACVCALSHIHTYTENPKNWKSRHKYKTIKRKKFKHFQMRKIVYKSTEKLILYWLSTSGHRAYFLTIFISSIVNSV